jgi:hypothetical protein|eukprot:CAMPEP_0174280494 /NCGR_PEP_ID=MMETSP0809-20121228/769_1 /TAXON_ID=73025 ORGANISM="Eutreptiella gymnastica-like, Strain CCMP1594" /NCGR_SAMPLE_ID=MMETSP0809 /ASSEMBLY_ACC=CAM_ASM_000658 /LENGTH=34 /DNA_ID= /DNA_START= /DNA_END= /DNA_ORIENTATION=
MGPISASDWGVNIFTPEYNEDGVSVFTPEYSEEG